MVNFPLKIFQIEIAKHEKHTRMRIKLSLLRRFGMVTIGYHKTFMVGSTVFLTNRFSGYGPLSTAMIRRFITTGIIYLSTRLIRVIDQFITHHHHR